MARAPCVACARPRANGGYALEMTHTRVLGRRSAAVTRSRHSGRLIPALLAVGFAAALLATCPQTAHATPMVFEDRTPSIAWVVDGAVGGAQRVDAPVGPFRIYGTLTPGEAVDAKAGLSQAEPPGCVRQLAG